MRVVISGGTGFIGRRVVAALLERGDAVTVLTRSVQAAKRSVDSRATLVAWDPERAETWAQTVREGEAVIHLAGEGVADKRWSAARKRELRTSRVDTTARIARVIGGATGGPRVFVSASACGYYGMRMHDEAETSVESDPPGSDFLAQLCVQWENAAEPAKGPAVRVCHPRIGVVLGLEGGALAKMLPAFKMFVGGPLGDGKQYLSWVHETDVVRGILHGLDTESIDGAFNVTAPEPVTSNEFAHALGHALGRPSAARVPAIALKLAMGSEMADMVLRGQRALPKRLQETGFSFAFPTLASALLDLFRAQAA